MSFETFDTAIADAAEQRRLALAERFDSIVIFYWGPLFSPIEHVFRDFIEQEIEREDKADRRRSLTFILNTPGGTPEATEKLVEIMRHHFGKVTFVVPDQAMSAGTILCMSGDEIWMDYSSSLGPIDPQVPNREGLLVPAVGYLNKVREMAARPRLSGADLALLQGLDLAWLDLCEKAQSLTVELLKKWLVEYKFAQWTTHRSDPEKRGQAVTHDEKVARAEEIARKLSDNGVWHSHGRPIGLRALKDLRLEITDYTNEAQLRDDIRGFHDLLVEYAGTRSLNYLLHGRRRG